MARGVISGYLRCYNGASSPSFVAWMVLLVFSLCSCYQSENTGQGPAIITAKWHSDAVPEVEAGDAIQLNCVITNTSGSSVKIKGLSAGCSCVVVRQGDEVLTLPPNGESIVSLAYNSKGKEPGLQQIQLQAITETNVVNNLSSFLEIVVRRSYAAAPGRIDFGDIFCGAPVLSRVRLSYPPHLKPCTDDLKIELTLPWLLCDVKCPIDSPDTCELEVSGVAPVSLGRFLGNINVSIPSSPSNNKLVEIPIAGNVLGGALVYPKVQFLGSVGSVLKVDLSIRAKNLQATDVESVTATDRWAVGDSKITLASPGEIRLQVVLNLLTASDEKVVSDKIIIHGSTEGVAWTVDSKFLYCIDQTPNGIQ